MKCAVVMKPCPAGAVGFQQGKSKGKDKNKCKDKSGKDFKDKFKSGKKSKDKGVSKKFDGECGLWQVWSQAECRKREYDSKQSCWRLYSTCSKFSNNLVDDTIEDYEGDTKAGWVMNINKGNAPRLAQWADVEDNEQRICGDVRCTEEVNSRAS